jgi:hypothetical protein
MSKYNIDVLTKYCQEHSIILTKDYSVDKLKRETIIEGKCNNCSNQFSISFRKCIETIPLCRTCTNKSRVNKITATMLNKYGVSSALHLQEVKDKIKQTNLQKYGVESVMHVQEFKDKIVKTNIDRYGTTSALKNNDIKEKSKKTNIERYGVSNPMYVNEFKEKLVKTNLERYGVSNPLSSDIIKEQIKKTNLENLGVEYPTQSEEVREKCIKTNMKRYGVSNPLSSESIKEKIKQTSIKKYGTEHPMQNKEIMERSSNSQYRIKSYTLPSGKTINYQGYENYAFDKLLKEMSETDFVNGTKNVPEIWYVTSDGKHHRHYVDIFIPKQNKCIEVKSTWTLKLKQDNIFEKQKQAKEQGFQYEIWVFNKDGDLVECFN